MRKHKIIGGILPSVILVMALIFIYIKVNTISINVKFADTIILDGYGEISKNDINILKDIFNGIAWKESSACPFGGISLIFSSSENSVTLYPAGDDCDTVLVIYNEQKYCYGLGEKNNILMRKILAKYGIIWPCV